MNTCQHCQTELDNARAKNCKTCTSLLSEANRYGTYGFVMEAISAAKANGITGSEMHATMQEAMKTGTSKRNEFMSELRKRHAERREERNEEARFFQKNGYFPGSSDYDEDTQLEDDNPPARGNEYSDQIGIDG